MSTIFKRCFPFGEKTPEAKVIKQLPQQTQNVEAALNQPKAEGWPWPHVCAHWEVLAIPRDVTPKAEVNAPLHSQEQYKLRARGWGPIMAVIQLARGPALSHCKITHLSQAWWSYL
jgi:hypothetical protein